MTPWTTIATAPGDYMLRQRGDEFLVLVQGRVLMGSRSHQSEEALATLGCAGVPLQAHVLVGGLGFGYTLRAALDRLPPDVTVTVAERCAPIVEWNRGVLAPLARAPLDDPRVRVELADVQGLLARADTFDAVLLDVDNGPFAVSTPSNAELYSATGLQRARAALRRGGRLAVWSASADGRFEKRLRDAGFTVQPQPAGAHLVYLATRR